jgi:hypothetical protein
MTLAIVTCSTNLDQAASCLDSWSQHATTAPAIAVTAGKPYRGTVPTFRQAVDQALATTTADVIACLHDDLEITEDGWDAKVLLQFERHPACGLLGFGGATGLGASDMYLKPYDPMSLARIGFRSNLREAEVHGIRSLLPEKVACLDGFSQIGRRAFWLGLPLFEAEYGVPGHGVESTEGRHVPSYYVDKRPWTVLDGLGVKHHLYDGLLGCLARRYGWETWYLPIRCHHYGGRTAVGDPGYQAWANTQIAAGDLGFWTTAHKIGYDYFRDILPLRVWNA